MLHQSCFLAPSTVRAQKGHQTKQHLSLCEGPRCSQIFTFTSTFTVSCLYDKPAKSNCHKSDQRKKEKKCQWMHFLTCELCMHGWARHLLPSQAMSYLRIAFIGLYKKKNITDPCPISLLTSTYCIEAAGTQIDKLTAASIHPLY